MKRLLAYLLLTLSFGFIFNAKADDIRDFQIDGISLGDSLLDHFSKDEIKKQLSVLQALMLVMKLSVFGL